jgi:hypothetical protein
MGKQQLSIRQLNRPIWNKIWEEKVWRYREKSWSKN